MRLSLSRGGPPAQEEGEEEEEGTGERARCDLNLVMVYIFITFQSIYLLQGRTPIGGQYSGYSQLQANTSTMAASDGRGGRGGRGCGGSGGGGVTRGQGGGGGAHVESGGAGTEGGRTAISDLVPHQPNTVSLAISWYLSVVAVSSSIFPT